MGKGILLTWLDLNVTGQKENFKMDIMINVIFTIAFESNIFIFYFKKLHSSVSIY